MNNVTTIPTIDVFFLGSGLPDNLRKVINQLINQPGVSTPSAPDLVDALLFKYPMAHDWQSEIYSLGETELVALRSAKWWHSLFKISFDFPTRDVVHQDKSFILLQLDSITNLLLDEIKPIVSLREFYLFLLENQNLPGFMLILKDFYKTEASLLHS
jgi:hypothetical protein